MPLRLVVVEQAELGVHARGGGLDASEPARDGAAGIGSPETGKLSTALRVSRPHSSRFVSRLGHRIEFTDVMRARDLGIAIGDGVPGHEERASPTSPACASATRR